MQLVSVAIWHMFIMCNNPVVLKKFFNINCVHNLFVFLVQEHNMCIIRITVMPNVAIFWMHSKELH